MLERTSGKLGPDSIKYDLTEEMLDSVEFVNEKETKEMPEDDDFGSSDDEAAGGVIKTSDFDWLKLTEPQEDTYFTFINSSRNIMKKGSQAYNCYGRRGNMYLLVNYGFCFQNNHYDSVRCPLRLDIPILKTRLPDVKDMMADASSVDGAAVQDIRFKRHQFNATLMAYIRACFIEAGYKVDQRTKVGQSTTLLASKVEDLNFEMKCLRRYEEIALQMAHHVERTSPLEADLMMLESKGLKPKEKFALIYRSEMKKTMRAQLELIRFVSKVVGGG